MKKVFYTIFILFMAITLVACKGGEPTDPVDPTPTEDPTPTPVDTLAPLLFGVSDVVVDVGGEFDPLAGITATDNVDGNLTSQINVSGEYDLDVAGVYTLT
ncbi:MAG: DUF5011 domain-containing protein, partial [Acholeplasmataceae bacterium]|nr:DUF5011 domain-containing protein [Acholeplasmataceae bacterium]